MTEKYSIGDIVEVTRPGSGVGSWDIRKLAKITALGTTLTGLVIK